MDHYAKRFRFRHQIMNRRTGDGGSAQDWDKTLTPDISEVFQQELSVREVSLFASLGDGSTMSAKREQECEALVEKLDEFLLDQTRTIGWKILFSALMHKRMAAWEKEKTGPQKFQRLGRAMSRAARLFQGEGSSPVTDPAWYQFRKELIEELKLFFQQLADFVRGHDRPVRTAVLLEWTSSQIQRQPGSLPHLGRELDFLREYLSQADDSPIDLLRVGEKVSASQFFDQWMGWRTGLEPEQFRQKVSRIGRGSQRPPS